MFPCLLASYSYCTSVFPLNLTKFYLVSNLEVLNFDTNFVLANLCGFLTQIFVEEESLECDVVFYLQEEIKYFKVDVVVEIKLFFGTMGHFNPFDIAIRV